MKIGISNELISYITLMNDSNLQISIKISVGFFIRKEGLKNLREKIYGISQTIN